MGGGGEAAACTKYPERAEVGEMDEIVTMTFIGWSSAQIMWVQARLEPGFVLLSAGDRQT